MSNIHLLWQLQRCSKRSASSTEKMIAPQPCIKAEVLRSEFCQYTWLAHDLMPHLGCSRGAQLVVYAAYICQKRRRRCSAVDCRCMGRPGPEVSYVRPLVVSTYTCCWVLGLSDSGSWPASLRQASHAAGGLCWTCLLRLLASRSIGQLG
jgi:hypothetical protein